MIIEAAVIDFLTERHLATLSTLRADGSPHVTPVGFTVDVEAGVARVITSGTSYKARNARRGGPGALCQVDGRRWLTLYGDLQVRSDPESVHDAERRYAARYREPRPNPARVVIMMAIDRIVVRGC